jgi:beta-phosphoglucomutase-like phosphatase (HAD superfamily)
MVFSYRLLKENLRIAAMFVGYIFDLEGNLIDSVSHSLKSFQESLEQMGYVVSFEPFNSTRAWTGTRFFNF